MKFRALIIFLMIVLGPACSTPTPQGSKEAKFATGKPKGEKINEAQLQEELFRFANRFSADVRDGLSEPERSGNAKIRSEALLRRLMYNSAALDICLGPIPEANLLDMVTFVLLSQTVWEDYWVPKIFGNQGAPMTQRFGEASQAILRIASEALDVRQRDELVKLVHDWRRQNPDQVAIENVRLSAFAAESGARATEVDQEAGGLLASVESAAVVGDRALLLSERALFYAQRAPFLWRLQAQAGTREVLGEAMSALESSDRFLEQEPRIRALLADLNRTLESMQTLLAQASQNQSSLRISDNILKSLGDILHEWNLIPPQATPGAKTSELAGMAGTIDARMNRFLWRLFGFGCALLVLLGLVLFASRLGFWWVRRRYLLKRFAQNHQGQGGRAA